MNKLYRVREFAELAGVTVRTLHHYDRLALLRPSRTGTGYRVYGLGDLERLEQIVALKFLGLPLKQIKVLLDRGPCTLPDALQVQRRALEEKRWHLDRAIHAIRNAERSLQPGQPTDSALLRKIIEVIEMQNNMDYWKQYYSDEAWTKLAEKRQQFSAEDVEKGTAAWTELFREIELALGEDPVSAHAQSLVARWRGLVESFTGGDAEVSAGLRRAWADQEHWPDQLQQQTADFRDPRIWEFIQRAMQAGSKP